MDRDTHTQPLHMDRNTHTQRLHMDRDTRMRSFQGRDASSIAGVPSHIGAAALGRRNSSSNISDHVVRLCTSITGWFSSAKKSNIRKTTENGSDC